LIFALANFLSNFSNKRLTFERPVDYSDFTLEQPLERSPGMPPKDVSSNGANRDAGVAKGGPAHGAKAQGDADSAKGQIATTAVSGGNRGQAPHGAANGGKSQTAADVAERLRAVENAISGIEKQFGKGSIMKLGDNARMKVATIQTGILPLDVALGVGGLPRGRVVEIYGPESGGKTTVSLQVVAQVQRNGGIAAFIDAEHALDPIYAAKLGVDIENLLVSQPDTGEQALEIAEALVRSGAVDLVVVDSVAALVPKAELEGEMGDAHVGLQARLMSQALRKLTAAIGKSSSIVIFINQLREKVGVMFGNPEVTTGGRALRFYASIRVEVRRIETLKKEGVEFGNRVKAKVVKNKVAPPFKVAEFDLYFGDGVSREGCILDMAAEMGIVQKSGTWYAYGETKLGQGRDAARQFLVANQDMADELDRMVRTKLSLINSESIRDDE
jgi:recombination protein RecA